MNIVLIIIGILFFNLIVFVHEFGHFFWAKKFGVKVNEFALGMGPRILKFKKGETIFSLRAFPIGGFCDMEGEEEKVDSPTSFGKKPAWQRFIIVLFGAVMNIILGFIMSGIILSQNPYFTSTTISKFSPDAVSSTTGLQIGDQIIKIDGSDIHNFKDLAFNLSVDGKGQFDITVLRNQEVVELQEVHFQTKTGDNGKSVTCLDFYLEPIPKSFWSFIKQTWYDVISTIKVVWVGLIGLITGRFSISAMSGPVGIANMIGEATNEGLKTSFLTAFNNILAIMMALTINLGVVNLLPLPALDGGRLMFLLFEIITRKKIKEKYEGWIHALGFILFIGLTIYMFYSDIMKIFWKA